ncbi:TVP38/TMEM64 family protein [Thalassotalea mangrovi]|uniref:TVP38/TMEM64 family membrane protein n=1 Tax=Thalassotalea mangrovi TaxID=2572245 RepID=A0A4V5NUR6_9GAMM|nr:VTT domain-containing protein [Thalassotalea mangrovi]TKB46439.1 VTT domain-containing protein [Thalassotalea mangrovi]
MISALSTPVKKHLLKAILSFALFLSIALILQNYLFEDMFSTPFWRQLSPSSISVQVAFIAVAAITTMFGFPRQAIAFVAGYGLGFWHGTLIATFATLLGSVLCFSFATRLSTHYQLATSSKLVKRLSAFLASNVFQKTLIVRLFPFGSNLLTNLAAGISQVNKVAFFSATLIGYLPQMIIFSLSGSGINMQSQWQLLLSGLLLCISLGLGVWLYRKEQKQKSENPFISPGHDEH